MKRIERIAGMKTLLVILTAMIMCMQPVFAVAASDTGQDTGINITSVKMYWASEYTHKTIAPGKKYSIKKKLRPKGVKAKYSSTRKKVAKVSRKGVVKAGKKGKAVIVVKNKKTKEVLKYHIHVGTKVKRVKWKNAGKRKVVYMGRKFNFNSKCTPVKAAYRKVRYKTSDPKVLTVSKAGVVKPLKNGTATITASAADQSGSSVKCKVRVKTRAASVKLGKVRDFYFAGEELDIDSVVLPETASNKSIRWTSSNEEVATVSKDGKVRCISSGTAKISAATIDGSGKKASREVCVLDRPDPSKVWFNAHRGYSGRYPENTLQAFAAAAGLGFSGIETDVWENETFYSEEDMNETSKTNPEFVIMHDQTLERMCGVDFNVKNLTEKNIDKYPVINGNGNAPAVTYRIPVLEEYIDQMAAGGKTLVIEMKDAELSQEGAAKLIEMLDEKGVAKRTHIISFNRNSLLRVKSELRGRTDIKLTRLLGARDKGSFENEIQWCIDNKMDEVSISDEYMQDEYIERIKQAGMQAGVWVVDDIYAAADFFRKGCDHVTTNTVLW